MYDLKKWSIEKNKGIVAFVVLWILIEVIDVAYDSYFIGTWIFCYVLGFFLPEVISRLSVLKQKAILALLTVAAVPITYLWYMTRYIIQPQYEAGWRNDICEYIINYTRSYDALIIILLILFICSCRPVKGSGIKGFLDLSDRYSFDIYIAHMIYVKGAWTLLGVTDFYVVNVCLMLVASICSGVVLYSVCALLRKKFRFSDGDDAYVKRKN